MKKLLMAAVLFSTVSPALQAEEIGEILGNLNRYVQEQNYPKALTELEWARKELVRLRAERLKAFFAESVAGYQSELIQEERGLGFAGISRRYTRGDEAITVSLAGGMAGLEQMMEQMAALLQGAPAGASDTFRIGGRTAVLHDDPGGGEMMLSIKLNSGMQLKFTMRGATSAEKLKAFAEAFDVDGLDTYLAQ